MLSRSDAQVPVDRGWPVPYIRLTRSNHPQDTQTWFLHRFFAGVPWHPGFFGNHVVEEANVAFEVTLPGQPTLMRHLMITHDDSRGNTGKSTPNTWVHWDDVTRDELRATNYHGRPIVLERSDAGVFSLTII